MVNTLPTTTVQRMCASPKERSFPSRTKETTWMKMIIPQTKTHQWIDMGTIFLIIKTHCHIALYPMIHYANSWNITEYLPVKLKTLLTLTLDGTLINLQETASFVTTRPSLTYWKTSLCKSSLHHQIDTTLTPKAP